ncbi:ferrous iron transport protein B [Spirosomataceae bacterium TFI 002]|nr:ferrous iron transport protein B [Spirosomataceae bacterium TFI 002]
MKVALVGNPNSGKTSLFNQLTGLHQKVGNFPGVTVDKKTGKAKLPNGVTITVLDLPGTYSLYPNSLDENVVLDILLNPDNSDFPDIIVAVVDASNLKRSLLLFYQVKALGIPCLLVLNQLDEALDKGIVLDPQKLSEKLDVDVLEINAREGLGINNLKDILARPQVLKELEVEDLSPEYTKVAKEVGEFLNEPNQYRNLQIAAQGEKLSFLTTAEFVGIEKIKKELNFIPSKFQTWETMMRFGAISELQKEVQRTKNTEITTSWLDKILLHKVWGYVIFAFILGSVFQAVFVLANYPADLIDAGIAALTSTLREVLPAGKFADLLTDGLIAGIGGVVIFIPQIALLFGFITIMEETGYMARVIVLMDKLVRKFGMSGRSVVPLISSMACAVPAIMSARTIGNWKERIVTIMVTPLMSCQARLPIYTILIALVVPNELFLGFIGYQGLALMGLYFLGAISALLAGLVIKKFIKSDSKSMFFMELPAFRPPRWSEVAYTIYEKSKTFVLEAGKVILAISLVLWVLSSYGPGESFSGAEERIVQASPELQGAELEDAIAAEKLQNSYAGHFGKTIEPVIRPLGYDWKIGIALIASFAAREVFVGTMSTIYSIGSKTEEDGTIKARLKREKDPVTGEPVFGVATSFSLLVFYVFAMMCMSTIAVVYRETKGWKWPMIQLAYMSVLAYVAAFIVYQLLK